MGPRTVVAIPWWAAFFVFLFELFLWFSIIVLAAIVFICGAIYIGLDELYKAHQRRKTQRKVVNR